MKKIAYLFVICLFSASCVSSKKYKQQTSMLNTLQKDYAALELVKAEKERIDALLRQTNAALKANTDETNELKNQYSALEQSKNDLLQRFDQIVDANKSVLTTAAGEKQVLSEQLTAQQKENFKKEKQLKELEAQLKSKQTGLDQLNTNLADREKKVKELQGILDGQNRKLSELKTKLSAALKGFSASDLTVREQDGKVYVSLSQNLLFATGSDKIDPKGKDALKQLAAVLAANTEMEIMVEGHTDSDGAADLNWDLSANRALAVVKVLTSNKVDGKRITAAGRGMYVPIADNKDAIGKGKNRRTDIILSPKLDELYKIINGEK